MYCPKHVGLIVFGIHNLSFCGLILKNVLYYFDFGHPSLEGVRQTAKLVNAYLNVTRRQP
jgi:hypothetical protein